MCAWRPSKHFNSIMENQFFFLFFFSLCSVSSHTQFKFSNIHCIGRTMRLKKNTKMKWNSSSHPRYTHFWLGGIESIVQFPQHNQISNFVCNQKSGSCTLMGWKHFFFARSLSSTLRSQGFKWKRQTMCMNEWEDGKKNEKTFFYFPHVQWHSVETYQIMLPRSCTRLCMLWGNLRYWPSLDAFLWFFFCRIFFLLLPNEFLFLFLHFRVVFFLSKGSLAVNWRRMMRNKLHYY